ncbi:hypothetical protein PVAND_009549 [Polypedilum vanderplanki]|uniref:Uncharacterized protein n=1 Tax=Polypedilum vanderplanki TaxID=319348 RepID=A0A9J6CDX3_POLVA|nr:hypothetical protein PVAND_009549 [Polypedilum vanderplanki]
MYDSIIVSACEIIQDNYLLLRSMNELDNVTLDKFQKLVKLLQGQRSVKFANDESESTIHTVNGEDSSTYQHLEISLNNFGEEIHLQSPTDALSKKRAFGLDDEVDAKKMRSDETFVRPAAMKKIQFDALPSASTHDMNSTFSMEMPPPKILHEKTNQTSAITKALRQAKSASSSSSSSSKYVLNINKENKKFSPSSNRIKKPRTPNRLLGSRAPASLAHRPKLVKTAVSSSLTTVSDKKFKTQKK